LERNLLRHFQPAKGISFVTGHHSKAMVGSADRGVPGSIGRSGQRDLGTRGQQRRTTSVLCESHAPRGRDKVPNDRETGTSIGSDRKADATILSKPCHNGKNQLPYI